MAITVVPPPFNHPPLDGRLSIPEVYDWHRDNNPNHPIFLYAGQDTHTISYSQFYDAYHRAGAIAASLFGIDIAAVREDCPVVGVLSTSDTISTFTNIIGLFRLGAVPFPISPRFSSRVVAHLLKSAGISRVLVNTDRHLCSLMQEVVSLMSANKNDENTVQVHTLPEYDVLYSGTWYPRLPKKNYHQSSPAIIIHSSSSTSDFPKVVPWTIGMQTQHSLIPTSVNQCIHKLNGAVISCHSIELFHTFGLLFLYWTPMSGLVLGTFEPSLPAVLPTAELCFQGILATKSQYVLTHTRFLEEWATDESKIAHLGTLDAVFFGGKILKQAAGDTLARSGVKLCNAYGSTEGGHVSAVPPDHLGEDWDYFQRSPQCKMEFIDLGDGTFHAIIISTEEQVSPSVNIDFQGQKAFGTGDILIPHPTQKDYWKVLGRVDDQIMLSSGEVIHPVRLENMISVNPYVRSAQLFGQARPHLGILVELQEISPVLSTEEAQDLIWLSIHIMNKSQPSFCFVAHQMIVIISPTKPMIYTPKGAPKRAHNLCLYRDEIDKRYEGCIDPYLIAHPAYGSTSMKMN